MAWVPTWMLLFLLPINHWMKNTHYCNLQHQRGHLVSKSKSQESWGKKGRKETRKNSFLKQKRRIWEKKVKGLPGPVWSPIVNTSLWAVWGPGLQHTLGLKSRGWRFCGDTPFQRRGVVKSFLFSVARDVFGLLPGPRRAAPFGPPPPEHQLQCRARG